MLRNRFLLAMTVALLLVFTEATPAPKAIATDQNSLPMLLISYAYGLANGMDTRSGNSKEDTALAALYRSLENNLDQLHVDVPTKLAFVRKSYVVQPTEIGSRTISEHGRSTLYVTEPVREIGNASVAIVSSVSPESTTIFMIDSQLHVTLVYDSVAANHFSTSASCDPLGQVNGVEVIRQGVLKLTESNARWSDKHKRVIDLDVTNKTPVLHCSF